MPARGPVWLTLEGGDRHFYSARFKKGFVQTHFCSVRWWVDGRLCIELRCDLLDNGDSIAPKGPLRVSFITLHPHT